MIAQRYSCLPSDLLKIDIADYQFNQLCVLTALNSENKKLEKDRRPNVG